MPIWWAQSFLGSPVTAKLRPEASPSNASTISPGHWTSHSPGPRLPPPIMDINIDALPQPLWLLTSAHASAGYSVRYNINAEHFRHQRDLT